MVPDGVSTVHVVAIGAPGAVGFGGGTAGLGAEVSGDLAVTPGDPLYVNVGGAPTNVAGNCFENVACIGGFNGGGSSIYAFGGVGGGGGGASDVRTVSRDQDGSLASRLIVAGGGGGSGEGRGCGIEGPILPGGTGGDAGSDGGDGTPCDSIAGGTGGDAGSQSAGGSGGSPEGQSGSLGLGGNGGGSFGGGGGGGYYGGGGGGGLNVASAAGGGGGGSNLVPIGGTASVPLAATGPSVTISYTVTKPAPKTKDECKKGGFRNFGFPDQGTCITAFNENRPPRR